MAPELHEDIILKKGLNPSLLPLESPGNALNVKILVKITFEDRRLNLASEGLAGGQSSIDHQARPGDPGRLR